ncbi:uncharacterized protein LAESUDRAFT_67350 [Laetiporus sulphureus 93-53]|uniref:Uncharacterized protein n=1 Tax=Laetiporus sulphureus 93-53 TaxID=1314785 RepID=A0A165F5S3_9APHY|nr:uncharacterized protein LAESUDRAFT_67350 [Laetiporus sulphureus 93-53]KZT08443.1 hypothetical protein LAESUDRAFT_67350 [Laetiporus sulphureus 93-53]
MASRVWTRCVRVYTLLGFGGVNPIADASHRFCLACVSIIAYASFHAISTVCGGQGAIARSAAPCAHRFLRGRRTRSRLVMGTSFDSICSPLHSCTGPFPCFCTLSLRLGC